MLFTCAILLLSARAAAARPFSFADLFQPYAPTANGQSPAANPNDANPSAVNAYSAASPYATAVDPLALQQRAYALATAQAGRSQPAPDAGRTFVHIKHQKRRRRRRRRRPCRVRDSRTWPNVNFVYLEVNEHYDCGTAYGGGGGGQHGGIFGGGQHGGSSNHVDEDEDEYDDIIDEYNDPVTVTNSHGSLASAPSAGQAAANRPSGGPLGFFGQGGLFDFGGGQSGGPVGGGGQNQLVGVNQLHGGGGYDDVRPVIEINVPESLSDAVRTFAQVNYAYIKYVYIHVCPEFRPNYIQFGRD